MNIEFTPEGSAFLKYLAQRSVTPVIKSNEIYCACPICGDSRLGRKKRLHLYRFSSNGNEVYVVNCFNGGCEVQNMSIRSFFMQYDKQSFQKLCRPTYSKIEIPNPFKKINNYPKNLTYETFLDYLEQSKELYDIICEKNLLDRAIKKFNGCLSD